MALIVTVILLRAGRKVPLASLQGADTVVSLEGKLPVNLRRLDSTSVNHCDQEGKSRAGLFCSSEFAI